jgi:NAD(P)-dependent dehydrogenase (short-subunit alcohol dehydrogenase family)
MSTTYESTILITGGTSGLGLAAAHSLASSQKDKLILLASRTDISSAAVSINKKTGTSNTQYIPLDLGSLASVRAFASKYASASYPPISALVLNAALQFVGPPNFTPDNIETTFAVNHVAHALLFNLLTPHLTPDAQIIVVASGVHDPAQKTGMPDAVYTTAAALAQPTSDIALKDGRQQYTNSKLANVLWTYALERRVRDAGKGWSVNAFDPGLMPGTGLARDNGVVLRFIWRILPVFIPLLRVVMFENIHTTVESGRALAGCAVEGEGASGKYYEGGRVIKSSEESYMVEKQQELWGWTLDAVSKDKEERARFERLE